MSHEFNEAEMMPCDLCGDYWPADDMYELEDGRICCPNCIDEVESND